jgi:hypothetical protein
MKGMEFRLAQRKNGYFSACKIASLYSDLEEKDQAFHWLDVAYQECDRNLLFLNTWCLLDPLRSDPRFAELVRKVGLPQQRKPFSLSTPGVDPDIPILKQAKAEYAKLQ